MPIYEYACPKCRVIFSFLSKRINPDRSPVCPKCGNKKMSKQLSRFAMSRKLKEPAAKPEAEGGEPPMPDMDDPRVEREMMRLMQDAEGLDENDPRQLGSFMRRSSRCRRLPRRVISILPRKASGGPWSACSLASPAWSRRAAGLALRGTRLGGPHRLRARQPRRRPTPPTSTPARRR